MSASSERHERFHSARRDPRLCVLEGLHAIKHALRFDAPIEEVVTRDATELAQLATELAPDVAARMLELATAPSRYAPRRVSTTRSLWRVSRDRRLAPGDSWHSMPTHPR